MVRHKDISYPDDGGYSGSPVFVKDKSNKKWVFLGTAIAVFDGHKLVVTKSQIVNEKISEAK